MATEEQLENDIAGTYVSGVTRTGFRVTISNRIISHLSFLLKKLGTPSGDVTYTIRKVSDDNIIVSKILMAADDLPTSFTWEEVEFTTPTLINEEVRILCECPVGDAHNRIDVRAQDSDIKADEIRTAYINAAYDDEPTEDATYKYTYEGGSTAAPSVTIQAVTDIDKTTATGNGTVISLGVPAATAYRHCWATFPNPTTANDKTVGVPSATGAFTSSLTGLTQNTKYYVRAYITNSVGTSYSTLDAEFTTLADVPVVTTDLVTQVAVTTAQGNGSIDNNGGSAVTQHGVCWGASANPTIADSKTEEGATSVIGDFSSLMTGLTAEITYHVRAYATNADGTGYGVDKTFTTHAVGAPIVTTQRSTSVTAESATGKGTTVDVGGSAVTEHGHCWGTSANPTTAGSKTTLGAGSVGAFTSKITELSAGTAYYIRAYATNSYGTSYGDNDVINQVAGELKGVIAILGKLQVYTDKFGDRRALFGERY